MIDPVLDWLKRHSHLAPRLDSAINFHLDLATIRLRTNSPDLINMMAESFRYYDTKDNPHAPILHVEIYSIEKIDSFEGFDPFTEWGHAVSLDDTISLTDNTSAGRVKPLKIGEIACLWRPFDYLVSYPNRYMARILTTDSLRVKTGTSSTTKLTMKGKPLRPENTPDLIDLIKILYIRSCNLCCLHGAVASHRSRGVLITGPSGCGKTTTVLSLVRHGFDLLTDELALIEPRKDETFRLRGLLIQPMVMGEKGTRLKTLETSLNATNNGSKSPLRLDRQIIEASRDLAVFPEVIVYLAPRKNAICDHELTPMPTLSGFSLLADQILDMPGIDRRQFQFETLTGLLAATRQYRLVAGNNLASLAKLVGNLITK